MILEAEFSRPLAPGAWRLCPESHGKTAFVACPKCRTILLVGKVHGTPITKSGRVKSDIECVGCHSILTVTLKDWRSVRSLVREAYLMYLAKVQ